MSDIAADAVVVGSGFAGALLADRLAGQGIRTTILEAGPRVNRARAFETFLGAAAKTPESPYERSPEADFPASENPDHWYRQAGPDKFKSTYLKAVGGTSWHWLGTCVRFLPNDFRLQSRFGRGVDWPIGYGEIEPFYLAAEHELGVAGDSADDLGSPRSGPFPMPPIPPSWLDGVCERDAGRYALARAAHAAGAQLRSTPGPTGLLRQRQLHPDLSGGRQVRRHGSPAPGRGAGRRAA